MSQKSKKKKALAAESDAKSKNKKPVSSVKSANSRIYVLLLLVITLVLFYPSFSYKFVQWDDNINLYENKALDIFANQWNWDAVKHIFTSDIGGNYNPLPIFTFAVEKYFFAPDVLENTGVFHFTNVMLHLLCTWMVFLLFRRLGLGVFAAFIGALLFGIHPMRVESVAWVTERKDVLYGVFFLASLLTYLRYARLEQDKTKWYVLTIVLSIFSYFAKIQAVTIPLTMVALDFFIGRKWFSFKILVLEKLPWWALSLTFGLINISFLREAETISTQVVHSGLIDRLAIGAFSYVVYLVKFIYPYTMSPLYPYPPEIPVIYYVALAVVPVGIIIFLIRAWKKQHRTALFAWAFFTFNVMFLLQILAAGQGFLADRFTYIAYTGLFFLVAYFMEHWSKTIPASKNVFSGVAVVYVCMSFLISTQQLKIWENSGALWEKVIEEYPDVHQGYLNAGVYYRDGPKEFDKAKQYLMKALSLQPNSPDCLNSLSKFYVDYAVTLPANTPEEKRRKGAMFDSAIFNYNLALKYDSIAPGPHLKWQGEAFINRGGCYLLMGNFDAALNDLSKGIALNPDNENGYANRALIYISRNQNELAIKDFDSYLELVPQKTNMYYERGMCKFKIKKYQAALDDINQAFAMGDSRPLYFFGRAQIYKAMGNTEAMRREAQAAKQGGLNVPAEFLQ